MVRVPAARAFVILVDPLRGGWQPDVDATGDGMALNVRALSQVCPHVGCRPRIDRGDPRPRLPCGRVPARRDARLRAARGRSLGAGDGDHRRVHDRRLPRLDRRAGRDRSPWAMGSVRFDLAVMPGHGVDGGRRRCAFRISVPTDWYGGVPADREGQGVASTLRLRPDHAPRPRTRSVSVWWRLDARVAPLVGANNVFAKQDLSRSSRRPDRRPGRARSWTPDPAADPARLHPSRASGRTRGWSART